MRFILISGFIFTSLPSFGQDLTGTWEGVFGTDNIIPGRRSSFMHMELKQDGRKIEGIFYYASPSTKQIDMMYELSGELGKKKLFPFRLVRGKILIDGFNLTGFTQFENIRYLKNDTAQILYGKWLSDVIIRSGPTAGGFSIHKIDTTHLLLDEKRQAK
ncbi:MAG TPA: hypothetical protein VMY77_01340 [Chitinophagaceae bacterium]|nr:hypothetical protein [Chitinophagaceae bacterium]